jgi:hypothetical protein
MGVAWQNETFITHVMSGLQWALEGASTRAYGAGLVGNQDTTSSGGNGTSTTTATSASSSAGAGVSPSGTSGSGASASASASAGGATSGEKGAPIGRGVIGAVLGGVAAGIALIA